MDNVAVVMLHCIFGIMFTMPIPPGELMTKENLISKERHQKSRIYGHVTKLFLESEFHHKENKQMKKHEF